MSDLARQKDLEQARSVREHNEAEKKRKALRMLGDGRPVAEIAVSVGATRATVQKWKMEMGNG